MLIERKRLQYGIYHPFSIFSSSRAILSTPSPAFPPLSPFDIRLRTLYRDAVPTRVRLVSLSSPSLLPSCSCLALDFVSDDPRTLGNNADLLICVSTHLTSTLSTPSELDSAERTHSASTSRLNHRQSSPQVCVCPTVKSLAVVVAGQTRRKGRRMHFRNHSNTDHVHETESSGKGNILGHPRLA
jgi:hypothetical protein